MPVRCAGSGQRQMLAWMPDDNGYPGAVVCLKCDLGIQVRKGSVRKATSLTGFEGLSGVVKVHNRPAPRRQPNPESRTTYKKCAEEGCEEQLPNHAWGRIKAEGWFQQKNGDIWCPAHVPEWVEKWRKGKKKDA